MEEGKRYWFLAKTHGWGWGLPVTWQGWVVMAAYLASLVLVASLVSPAQSPMKFTLAVSMLSLTLVAVCWKTGEPPRWRWGKH